MTRKKRINLNTIPKITIQHDLIGYPFSYNLYCGNCGLEVRPEDESNMMCTSQSKDKYKSKCDLIVHGIVLIGDFNGKRVMGWDTLPKELKVIK